MNRVTALDVRCPTCGAVPGENCRTLPGAIPTVPHEPPHEARSSAARDEKRRRQP